MQLKLFEKKSKFLLGKTVLVGFVLLALRLEAAPVSGYVDGTGLMSTPGWGISNSPCSLAKFQFVVEGGVFRVPGAYFLCKDIQMGIINDLVFRIEGETLFVDSTPVGEWSADRVSFEARDLAASILYRFAWSKISESEAQVRYEIVTDPTYDPTFQFLGKLPLQ